MSLSGLLPGSSLTPQSTWSLLGFVQTVEMKTYWAKAGITALAVAASVPELRATWATAGERQELDGEATPSEIFRSLPARSKAVAFGVVAAGLAASIGGVLIAERWAFRHGQARAASGKRLPHTGPALLYGALASGPWLLRAPPDTN